MAKKAKTEEKPLAFEEAMEELEQIVEEMESDRMALNDLVDHYERGSMLLKICQKRLGEAEQRIQLIVARDSGVELKEFEEGESNTSPDDDNTERNDTADAEDVDADDDEIRLF